MFSLGPDLWYHSVTPNVRAIVVRLFRGKPDATPRNLLLQAKILTTVPPYCNKIVLLI